jgi:hypothetical protein
MAGCTRAVRTTASLQVLQARRRLQAMEFGTAPSRQPRSLHRLEQLSTS